MRRSRHLHLTCLLAEHPSEPIAASLKTVLVPLLPESTARKAGALPIVLAALLVGSSAPPRNSLHMINARLNAALHERESVSAKSEMRELKTLRHHEAIAGAIATVTIIRTAARDDTANTANCLAETSHQKCRRQTRSSSTSRTLRASSRQTTPQCQGALKRILRLRACGIRKSTGAVLADLPTSAAGLGITDPPEVTGAVRDRHLIKPSHHRDPTLALKKQPQLRKLPARKSRESQEKRGTTGEKKGAGHGRPRRRRSNLPLESKRSSRRYLLEQAAGYLRHLAVTLTITKNE
ncbi:hypothetical protein BX600DRAFT_244363 [Xylariales sp. PMI_506]|nr:hypothetical protein BX600DRAFT_244363 [Xylariales sp. PMI_506]